MFGSATCVGLRGCAVSFVGCVCLLVALFVVGVCSTHVRRKAHHQIGWYLAARWRQAQQQYQKHAAAAAAWQHGRPARNDRASYRPFDESMPWWLALFGSVMYVELRGCAMLFAAELVAACLSLACLLG